MRRIWWGIVIILVGFWIWASSLNLPEFLQFRHSWPILIVLLGVSILCHGIRRAARRRACCRPDVISELEQGKIGVDEAVDRLKKGE